MAGPPLERRVAFALAVAATLALAAAMGVVANERGLAWRQIQRQYARTYGVPVPGVREVAPRGTPERCLTCHLDEKSLTARPLHAQHPPHRVGCVACHGGSGRSLEISAAHPRTGPNELRRGTFVQAGCGRCHTPGAVPGDRAVVEGLYLFTDLGCMACHRTGSVGAVAEFGPDLTTVGLRGSEYLRRVIRDPAKLFPGTKMPGFAPALAEKSREEALISYLLTLRGEPGLREPNVRVYVPCIACHGGASPLGQPHRCVYLRERGAVLACQRCHGKSPPASVRPCPVVESHRFMCNACHERNHGSRTP